MQYKWECRCEIYPNKEENLTFKSFEGVNRYVRNIISKHVDITSYIDKLKSYGNYKYFLDRAEFLKRYIEDPSFPHSKADFPLENPKDYDDYDTYFEKPEDFDDKPELKSEIKEGIENIEEFEFSGEHLYLKGVIDDFDFDFKSDFVLPDLDSLNNENIDEDMKVSFEGRLDITVTKQEYWEPSSYPLMVLKVLEDADEPLLQEEIGKRVKDKFFYYSPKKPLHRNIIGRNIKMLRDLGFIITRSKEGYLLDKSGINESPTIKEDSFGTKANSVMVLLVLQSADTPLTRNEIVEKIKERFNHKIEEKTVGRNVALLQDFDYIIKKFGNKGYLFQK